MQWTPGRSQEWRDMALGSYHQIGGPCNQRVRAGQGLDGSCCRIGGQGEGRPGRELRSGSCGGPGNGGAMTWRGEELCGELVSRSWEVQQSEGRVAPLVAGGDWGAQRWTNLSGPGARGARDQPPHRRQWDRPRLLWPLCPLQNPVSRSVQPCLLLCGDWVGQPLSHRNHSRHL